MPDKATLAAYRAAYNRRRVQEQRAQHEARIRAYLGPLGDIQWTSHAVTQTRIQHALCNANINTFEALRDAQAAGYPMCNFGAKCAYLVDAALAKLNQP